MTVEPWMERVRSAEPEPGDQVRPGDIVTHAEHTWDVRGWDTLSAPDPEGTVSVMLHLERTERPAGRKKKVVRARVDQRRVRLVGRQFILPGTPEPEAETRQYD